jgi:hypothetical protein
MSVVVRVPEELYESAKRIAALQGRQLSDVLSEAWEQYFAAHREQFADDFERAAALIRAGDTDGLTKLTNRTVRARAEAAAGAADAERSAS